MGGYPVLPEVKELIRSAWLYLKQEGGEPTAKEVLERVRMCLIKSGKPNVPLPKLRKIQMLLSEIREDYSRRSEYQKIQDKLWTMATLNEYELPSNSISHIGKVWLYAISADEPFTIRQAKWVSRIYTLYDNVTMLWWMSRRYSRFEEVSEVSEKDEVKPDAFLIDSNLFLSDWEQSTLSRTDFRKTPVRYFQPFEDRFLPIKNDKTIVLELLHGFRNYQIADMEKSFLDERYSEISDLINELPTIQELGFTFEAQLVYLRWFTYLSKAPNWNSLTPQEIVDVIARLRETILHEQEFRSRDKSKITPEPLESELFSLGEPELPELDFLTSDSPDFFNNLSYLMKRVGYWKDSKENAAEEKQ